MYVLLMVLDYIHGLQWWWYLLPLFIWFAIAGLGSAFIRSNYHINALCSNEDIKGNKIAITFDDGPHPETENVLRLLEKYNAKGTFFCIGSQIEKYPEIFKKIIDQGHVVGNHTYTHSPKMGFFSTARVSDELQRTNKIIEITGSKNVKLSRPPYGVTSPSIAKALKRAGLYVIGWNIRSLDTVIKEEDVIFRRIKNMLAPGSIILLHDTSARTVNVLEQLLVLLQQNNYEAITVDELLNIPAYEE